MYYLLSLLSNTTTIISAQNDRYFKLTWSRLIKIRPTFTLKLLIASTLLGWVTKHFKTRLIWAKSCHNLAICFSNDFHSICVLWWHETSAVNSSFKKCQYTMTYVTNQRLNGCFSCQPVSICLLKIKKAIYFCISVSNYFRQFFYIHNS